MKDFEKLDELLWQELSSNNEPEDSLNQQIIDKVRRKNSMKGINKRRISAVAMLVIIIATTSITAFAAWHLLTPKQVAENLGDKRLAIAFEGEDGVAINETQISGDYRVTLLGIASGKKISDFQSTGENIDPERSYAVVAIANVDDTPMPDTRDEEYGKVPFFVSPFIKGQDPNRFNIITMNGGYSEFVKDGIMYRIIECDDIEKFADRGLYLGVTSTDFYDTEAYNFDLETGEINRNDDYEGVNALFNLPIEPSKGNYEEAEKYLQKLADEQTSDQEDKDEELVDIETLLAGATLIKESVQEVSPDKEGVIIYEFDRHDTRTPVEYLFKEGQVGFSDVIYSDEDNIIVFSRDKDGVITGMTYRKKQ